MRNLLDDLRNAPTPLVVTSRAGILKAVKDVHLEVIKHSLRLDNNVDVSKKVTSLRRYALWLEDVAFEALGNRGQPTEVNDSESLFSSAATLYEFTGYLSSQADPKSIFQPPLNDLLRSAILSSFTPYQAHSSLIGQRVRHILKKYSTEDPGLTCHLIVASTVAALVGREFHIAFSLSKQLDDLQEPAIDAMKERDATNRELQELDKSLAIGRACGKAALGMLIGVMPLIHQATERLEQIRHSAAKVEDANHHWLADRLFYLTRNMGNASMHKILLDAKLPTRYRQALARDGFFEFWEPQLHAIEEGLLDSVANRHFVVSIPTGAGKTLFAELGLLTALGGRNPGWAIYVTPSRALVSQVSSDLRRRLERCNITVRTIVAGAEQSEILDEELDLMKMNRTVTVTTPEKLDAYYRNAQEIFSSCRLAIFDEVHKVSEPGRGPILESLVARFLSLQPQTRILFLSGVMSNIDEMKCWLGEGGTVAITERERPTRRVYGVAVRGEETGRGKPATRKNSKTRRVDFAGGLVVVHESEDLEENLHVNLPNVFRGYYYERFYPQAPRHFQWREDRKARHSSANDHAIGLAQAIAGSPGTVLVFMHSVDSVQRGCQELNYVDYDFQKERMDLASFIAAELGQDHPLSKYCQRGVAYHHARLPNGVQRAIELALSQGWLKVVFATATLREGMNTAATTVIIAGHSVFEESANRLTPIPEADFMNLAGRAGRPHTDTEGRVFLIPNSLIRATAIENGKKYILAGDAALRVKSQLAELASALNQADNIMQLPPMHQSILLSLDAAGLTDPDSVATFISHSLWSLQEEDEEFTQATTGRMVSAIGLAKKELGEERVKIASRLGLSLSSSEQLRIKLIEQQELFTEDFYLNDRRVEQVTALLLASLPLPEIRRGSLRKDVDPKAHVAPLIKWIGGVGYQSILEAAWESGALSKNDDVTDAVKYASDLSTWLSWSFGAAHSILRSIIGDVDTYIGILPLLVKYGVPTTAAAYISLLGVSDRTSAQILGNYFERTGLPPSLQEVSKWLESISNDIEKIMASQEHRLRTEIVTRQVRRGIYRISPYRMSRFLADVDIHEGSILTARRSKRELLLIHAGQVVGKSLNKPDLTLYTPEIVPLLVAVPISSVPRGQSGIMAIIGPASATAQE